MTDRHLIDYSTVRAEAEFAYQTIGKTPSLWPIIEEQRSNFMNIREVIRFIFDDLENQSNHHYIGILEWAFVQSIINAKKTEEFEWNIDNVMDIFYSNKDIQSML